MEHDTKISNKSGNTTFEEVLEKAISRRKVMQGGLVAAVGFMAPTALLAKGGTNKNNRYPELQKKRNEKHGIKNGKLIDFEPVSIEDGTGPMPSISPDYEYQVLIPWGTPIKSGVIPYNGEPNRRPTADEQAKMIGIGHDGMWFLPERARNRVSNKSGLLCINHEFGRNTHVLGKSAPESLEDVRLSQHAHGVSVVAIEKHSEKWDVVGSKYNRRIHVNTDVEFSGPVVESYEGRDLLDLNHRPDDAKGTVNNCSSGHTAWGTYLTCEENFNGYFGDKTAILVDEPDSNDPDDKIWQAVKWTSSPEQDRYGFEPAGFEYGWEKYDDRFDLSNGNFRNEDNRFGWVVEVDPLDPDSKPVKRTALGRFKHEGATMTIGKGGRAVVYMGDDQRFDYIYKFVSAGNWKSMRARGISPLDKGKLYVAKFNDDGTGEWLELTIDNPKLASKFKNQAEVLTYARLAADELGATPMDRPEWTTVGADGYVYCTLTNNSRRKEADAANPLAPNNDGHIIRWKDSKQFTGTTFDWDIFLIAETTHGTEDTFSDPDGIWADPVGRLFIETDGGQKDDLNNQLLVADIKTRELRRLLTGVTKDEITGLTVTPDQRTMFCNTQHPGNGDPKLTNFPADPDGITIPRDCTLVIRRKDGGIVGS